MQFDCSLILLPPVSDRSEECEDQGSGRRAIGARLVVFGFLPGRVRPMPSASTWLISVLALAAATCSFSYSFGSVGSSLRLRRGLHLGASGCSSTCRSVRTVACRASSSSSADQESDDGPKFAPPNINPENLLFAPGKSRYEQFYTGKEGQGSDAVDASSTEVPLPDGEGGEEGRGSNPFFIGYEDGLLQSLLDVHTANYGERPDVNDEEPSPPAASGMGGLQELIMGICEEEDLKREGESK